jgi:hypothetical protein
MKTRATYGIEMERFVRTQAILIPVRDDYPISVIRDAASSSEPAMVDWRRPSNYGSVPAAAQCINTCTLQTSTKHLFLLLLRPLPHNITVVTEQKPPQPLGILIVVMYHANQPRIVGDTL